MSMSVASSAHCKDQTAPNEEDRGVLAQFVGLAVGLVVDLAPVE
jgi:hypothetical protein